MDILNCHCKEGFLEEVTRIYKNCCNILVDFDFTLKELSRLAFLASGGQKLSCLSGREILPWVKKEFNLHCVTKQGEEA